ncbi:MAG: type I DNA topoisomerase [Candidatus Eisenbacteria bacterium]|uniref:DNA topoisomerase 1 n=1 Tax=Eiseniibacteriota bacterium TaxID=2212470 RepID=A0A948RVM1_UNCEI|nr:type I DNA topoisomerase [Candidatus Eisenbacteria bacterium]MBU1947599.1 type I DNA topoisomerase [Candidatus Eisenbacteria bacterium]MBU2690302.1 type I DNA topoisomerase [Candidatus Eisenbacteria bacterium]
MAKSLIIVESPAKARTIGRMVGNKYTVLASLGHIRDLPKSKLGVDLENNFSPAYTVIAAKKKIIKELKDAAKAADAVFLAPDPDREGEAIAWHLAEVLGKSASSYQRLIFHEITKNAVKHSLEHPQEIDQTKVGAQQARRIMDRLVGYLISPFLWSTIRYGLSAGRVQSVALRIVVDREIEIRAFVPQEYWSITANLLTDKGGKLTTKLHKINGKKPEITNEEEAKNLVEEAKSGSFKVSELKTTRRRRKPYAPYITSTLQQEAYKQLRSSAKKTMMVAQQLYEGLSVDGGDPVGLITYMRTDSTRISDEALSNVRDLVQSQFGSPYLPKEARLYRQKQRTQDAHEAIRPTDVTRTPDSLAKVLSKDQLSLYRLIWNRFVASQMSDQESDVTTVDVANGRLLFRASGTHLVFDGFTRLYRDTEENKDEDSVDLPELLEGDPLKLKRLEKKQHFTEAPPRYTEATLVKALEEKGIGRPSTYATIVSTILARDYVNRDKGRLLPTDLGETVVKLLIKTFPDIFNIDFTAKMEGELDGIEQGDVEWGHVVKDFYEPFQKDLAKAEESKSHLKEEIQEESDQECEKCGVKMVKKFGRNGPFLACPNYPECRFTKPLSPDEEPQKTDFKCEKCGAAMMLRRGRYGRFLACEHYPECKTTRAVPTGVPCARPDCSGGLVEKRSHRGRIFFGCDRYPDCDFAVWDRPVPVECPACKNPFLVEKETKTHGPHLYCPQCRFRGDRSLADGIVKEGVL